MLLRGQSYCAGVRPSTTTIVSTEVYRGRQRKNATCYRERYKNGTVRNNNNNNFLVPANAMMVVELGHLATLASNAPPSARASAIASAASSLSVTVRAAIEANGTITDQAGNTRYVYEVDGLGNITDIDDGNVPSLLSLPYLGYTSATDPMYLRTRNFTLSSSNPYYFTGTAASGVGSPHTGPNMIWHMGLIVQALTSTDDNEILQCLQYLKTTTAGTYFMHESFYKDNPNQYTRSWFAWANTLFGELIMTLADTRPGLIFK